MFFTFFKLCTSYQIAQRTTYGDSSKIQSLAQHQENTVLDPFILQDDTKFHVKSEKSVLPLSVMPYLLIENFHEILQSFRVHLSFHIDSHTVWKVSVFGDFLVRIFMHADITTPQIFLKLKKKYNNFFTYLLRALYTPFLYTCTF